MIEIPSDKSRNAIPDHQANEKKNCDSSSKVLYTKTHLEDQEVYGDRRYGYLTTSHAVLEIDVAVDSCINKLTNSSGSYESSRETSQSNQEITLTWIWKVNEKKKFFSMCKYLVWCPKVYIFFEK